MLVELWKADEDDHVTAFADYFKSTWVDSDLCYWHEAASNKCVHNNGLSVARILWLVTSTSCLESTNKRIKYDFLLRQMHSFEEFSQDVDKVLSYWSQHVKAAPNGQTLTKDTFPGASQVAHNSTEGNEEGVGVGKRLQASRRWHSC